MKNYSTILTGLAGECDVIKNLALKGWVPSLAYSNCPTFDIFCFEPKSKKSITIQVKTIRDKGNNNVNAFPIMGNRDKSNRSLFYEDVSGPYVFVYIDINNNFTHYILSKEQFITLSNKIEDDYDNKPRNKPLKSGNPMAMPRRSILDYKDKWDNLWL